MRLSLDEVYSLFHEFGHVLDYTVGSRVAGSLDESWWGTDFAEGPSFFFAAWARTPTVLERFAMDPATGEGISRDAVAMLRVEQAIEDISFLERHIALGRLDLAVHRPIEVDLDEARRAAWADISVPECRHSQAIARDPLVAATVIATHRNAGRCLRSSPGSLSIRGHVRATSRRQRSKRDARHNSPYRK